jgi:predicted NAD-dependent protein-ADP-ribosyltransferase YbiA (DUF1768 family)
MPLDISFIAPYPSNMLSNFYPHEFIFDGIRCASMEGLLQSFKFDKFSAQREICSLTGYEAKKAGYKRNSIWQSKQKLWWRGIPYNRDEDDYQRLLDLAFTALAKNDTFRKALIDTGNAKLTHSIGREFKHETILTLDEFTNRLETIRELILY